MILHVFFIIVLINKALVLILFEQIAHTHTHTHTYIYRHSKCEKGKNWMKQIDMNILVQTYMSGKDIKFRLQTYCVHNSNIFRFIPALLLKHQALFSCNFSSLLSYKYIYIHTHTHTHTLMYIQWCKNHIWIIYNKK